jgi:MOSC domain-containing protein YiiM
VTEPTWRGEIVAIHIAPEEGAPVVSVKEVRAVPGRGLEGDRYYKLSGGEAKRKLGPGNEVTFIEREAIEAIQREKGIGIGLGDSRRNVVTRGVPLNHLVDRTFRVGEVTLRGIELCEPLRHRAGLRAQVVREGVMRVGDAVTPEG